MAGGQRAVELAHALPLSLNDLDIYRVIGARHQVRQDAIVAVSVNPVEPLVLDATDARTEAPPEHGEGREVAERSGVTRRAVAQRRSRASGLTRSLAEAIRGFDSGFGLGFVVGPLGRSAAVWCKSFVFSSLPIRKVLVLPLAGGVSPPLPVVSLLFSVSYSQESSLLLLVLYYLFCTTCRCVRFARICGGRCVRFARILGFFCVRFARGKLLRITVTCGETSWL